MCQAVRAHNVEESGKPSSQKKIGGKKRADGAFKKGGSRKGMSPGGKPGKAGGRTEKKSSFGGKSGKAGGKERKGSKR